jgi:CRP-like cAMP-binding protein
VQFFQPLSARDKSAFLAKLSPCQVAAGEAVISQGDRGSTLYIVKRGAVEVCADGKVAASLTSGGYFGERALLTGEAAVATVTATEETELLCLSAADFESGTHARRTLLDTSTLGACAVWRQASPSTHRHVSDSAPPLAGRPSP